VAVEVRSSSRAVRLQLLMQDCKQRTACRMSYRTQLLVTRANDDLLGECLVVGLCVGYT